MSEAPAKSHEEILAKDKDWNFTSLDTHYITGKGKAYVIRCPITCVAFDWIIGRDVTVDGKLNKVVAVERFVHAGPVKMGEKISLLVSDFGSL